MSAEWLLVIVSLATGADVATRHPRGSLGYPSPEACALFGQAITQRTPRTSYRYEAVDGERRG